MLWEFATPTVNQPGGRQHWLASDLDICAPAALGAPPSRVYTLRSRFLIGIFRSTDSRRWREASKSNLSSRTEQYFQGCRTNSRTADVRLFVICRTLLAGKVKQHLQS
jgi:hypothetical protein